MMHAFGSVGHSSHAVAESEATSLDIPPLLRTQGNYADSFFVFLVGCLCPRPLLLMSEQFLGLVRHCTHPVSPQLSHVAKPRSGAPIDLLKVSPTELLGFGRCGVSDCYLNECGRR